MIRLMGFELFKMRKRSRSFMGFVVFLAINVLMLIGAKYGDLHGANAAANAVGGAMEVTGSPLSAELMAWLAVGSPMATGLVLMFLPIFVCVVTGEILAGENTEGTIRTLMARPVSRTGVFGAKLCASVIYTAALVAFIGASAYALGAAFFGVGGLLTFGLNNGVVWYGHGEALARLALAYGLMFVVAFTIGAIALFISVLVNNSLGAIGATIMLLFITLIICAIPNFEHWKPYLLGAHVAVGQKAFSDPLPWRDIGASLLCLGAYLVVALLGGLIVFRRKDVLA